MEIQKDYWHGILCGSAQFLFGCCFNEFPESVNDIPSNTPIKHPTKTVKENRDSAI